MYLRDRSFFIRRGGLVVLYAFIDNFVMTPPADAGKFSDDPLYSFRFKFQIQIQIHIQI
jgi:hypothetical protein